MTEAFDSSGPEESVFRLLVPARDTASSEAATIDVGGQRWQVVAHGAVPLRAEAPDFMCVSYSWGDERVPNPFDPQRPMSSRALPALEAAIAALRQDAVWLDAACMPVREPARRPCLQNMGAIYAAASSVVVVLSPSASTLVNKVRRGEGVTSEELLSLGADDWISRAWTYQEMANSKDINFVAAAGKDEAVNGEKLLNAVGYASAQFRKAEQIDGYEFRRRYPRLDALEALIDDWFRADLADQSAYRIMSAMVGRTAIDPDDYFYAMVGAVTATPLTDPKDAALSPPEYFMRVCERKGDFSFIYSSDRCALDDAGGWRPRPALLPIIPWSSVGKRQEGDLQADSLRLHNMGRVTLGPLDGAARTFIDGWLKTVRHSLPQDIEDAVRETLFRAGFSGCGEHVETTSGLFFPQHPMDNARNSAVVVATDIFFNFGAPGLLLESAKSGRSRFRDVGVFVGPVPQVKEAIDIR